jgi:hypothetical protein
MLHSLNGRL